MSKEFKFNEQQFFESLSEKIKNKIEQKYICRNDYYDTQIIFCKDKNQIIKIFRSILQDKRKVKAEQINFDKIETKLYDLHKQTKLIPSVISNIQMDNSRIPLIKFTIRKCISSTLKQKLESILSNSLTLKKLEVESKMTDMIKLLQINQLIFTYNALFKRQIFHNNLNLNNVLIDTNHILQITDVNFQKPFQVDKVLSKDFDSYQVKQQQDLNEKSRNSMFWYKRLKSDKNCSDMLDYCNLVKADLYSLLVTIILIINPDSNTVLFENEDLNTFFSNINTIGTKLKSFLSKITILNQEQKDKLQDQIHQQFLMDDSELDENYEHIQENFIIFLIKINLIRKDILFQQIPFMMQLSQTKGIEFKTLFLSKNLKTFFQLMKYDDVDIDHFNISSLLSSDQMESEINIFRQCTQKTDKLLTYDQKQWINLQNLQKFENQFDQINNLNHKFKPVTIMENIIIINQVKSSNFLKSTQLNTIYQMFKILKDPLLIFEFYITQFLPIQGFKIDHLPRTQYIIIISIHIRSLTILNDHLAKKTIDKKSQLLSFQIFHFIESLSANKNVDEMISCLKCQFEGLDTTYLMFVDQFLRLLYQVAYQSNRWDKNEEKAYLNSYKLAICLMCELVKSTFEINFEFDDFDEQEMDLTEITRDNVQFYCNAFRYCIYLESKVFPNLKNLISKQFRNTNEEELNVSESNTLIDQQITRILYKSNIRSYSYHIISKLHAIKNEVYQINQICMQQYFELFCLNADEDQTSDHLIARFESYSQLFYDQERLKNQIYIEDELNDRESPMNNDSKEPIIPFDKDNFIFDIVGSLINQLNFLLNSKYDQGRGEQCSELSLYYIIANYTQDIFKVVPFQQFKDIVSKILKDIFKLIYEIEFDDRRDIESSIFNNFKFLKKIILIYHLIFLSINKYHSQQQDFNQTNSKIEMSEIILDKDIPIERRISHIQILLSLFSDRIDHNLNNKIIILSRIFLYNLNQFLSIKRPRSNGRIMSSTSFRSIRTGTMSKCSKSEIQQRTISEFRSPTIWAQVSIDFLKNTAIRKSLYFMNDDTKGLPFLEKVMKDIRKSKVKLLNLNKKEKTNPVESYIKKHTAGVNKLLNVDISNSNYVISFGNDCRNQLLNYQDRVQRKQDIKLFDEGHFISESPVLDAINLNSNTILIASQKDLYFVDQTRFIDLIFETSENTMNLSTKNRRSTTADRSLFLLSVDQDRKYLDQVIAVENNQRLIIVDQREDKSANQQVTQVSSNDVHQFNGQVTSGCMLSDVDQVLSTQQGFMNVYDLRMPKIPTRTVYISSSAPEQLDKLNQIHQVQGVSNESIVVSYTSGEQNTSPTNSSNIDMHSASRVSIFNLNNQENYHDSQTRNIHQTPIQSKKEQFESTTPNWVTTPKLVYVDYNSKDTFNQEFFNKSDRLLQQLNTTLNPNVEDHSSNGINRLDILTKMKSEPVQFRQMSQSHQFKQWDNQLVSTHWDNTVQFWQNELDQFRTGRDRHRVLYEAKWQFDSSITDIASLPVTHDAKNQDLIVLGFNDGSIRFSSC